MANKNMLSIKQLRLLEVWKEDLFTEFSISEIMKRSKRKTKPWVFNVLKVFVKNKLLISQRKGNLDIYRLNLDNPHLVHFLQFLESQNHLDFPKLNVIIETTKNIPLKNYCLLVFGSYAEYSPKKLSDIDICFLIGNKNDKNKIIPYFEKVKQRSLTKIDEHYITFEEFLEMLLSEEENLGKQIFRKHILFFNAGIYYELIKEAYKNGFRS